MSKLTVFLCGMVLAFIGVESVGAIPVYYTDRTEFNAAALDAGIDLSFESFEDEIIPARTVEFTDFSVTGARDNWNVEGDLRYHTDGDQSIGSWGATFAFNSRILAFGVDVIDFGTCGSDCEPELLFDGFGDTNTTVLSGWGGGFNKRFFGVIETDNLGQETILSVDTLFLPDYPNWGDQIWFDALSYGIDPTFIPDPDPDPDPDPNPGPNPVPEPTTILLLASGLVGLLGFRRRFKK